MHLDLCAANILMDKSSVKAVAGPHRIDNITDRPAAEKISLPLRHALRAALDDHQGHAAR